MSAPKVLPKPETPNPKHGLGFRVYRFSVSVSGLEVLRLRGASMSGSPLMFLAL